MKILCRFCKMTRLQKNGGRRGGACFGSGANGGVAHTRAACRVAGASGFHPQPSPQAGALPDGLTEHHLAAPVGNRREGRRRGGAAPDVLVHILEEPDGCILIPLGVARRVRRIPPRAVRPRRTPRPVFPARRG